MGKAVRGYRYRVVARKPGVRKEREFVTLRKARVYAGAMTAAGYWVGVYEHDAVCPMCDSPFDTLMHVLGCDDA